MQTPDEVAANVQQAIYACEHTSMVGGSGCYTHGVLTEDFPAHEAGIIADFIRARDEVIRADERAKVMAGFKWDERARAASPYSRVEIQHVLDTGTWIRERRLVGPWEPDTRTPQQRSDDAMDELRRGLKGDE